MDQPRAAAVTLVVAFLAAVAFGLTAHTDVLGAGKPGRGAQRGGPRVALAQAVAIALNQNLRLPDAMLTVQERESERRAAYSDFFPQGQLQYAASGFKYMQSGTVQALANAHDSRWTFRMGRIGGVPAAVVDPAYPYRIDPYRSFTLVGTITQPLYTGGKLLNVYKYARLGVDFASLQVEVERQDLTLEVTEAYYDLMQGQKLLEVAEQSIRALEALRNQTLEFYKAGVVPKVDVLSTEGQLAQARIERTQSLNDIETARARLNLLLRYPQETPTQIVHDYGYVPSGYTIPGIYETAAANRLEIRQANISVDQAMTLIRAAQADLLPSVSLQVQGTRLNDDWNPFDKEAVNDWQVQGTFSWAFDMFRTRETVQARRVAHSRTFIARQLLVEEIMSAVKEAYADMKRFESDIFDNRKAVEFRRENFRINQERYKEQVATYIEVLDAQRQLAQAEGDYYTSLIQYRIGRAILERTMGILR